MIAEKCCKNKLPDIHLQYAMFLEDQGMRMYICVCVCMCVCVCVRVCVCVCV